MIGHPVDSLPSINLMLQIDERVVLSMGFEELCESLLNQ